MTPDDLPRTRTYTWRDPAASANNGAFASGKAALEAIRDGCVPQPPFAATLGMALVEVGDGRVVFALTPAEFHYNPLGVVQGGVTATLMDAAMACAIQTLLPAGVGCTTLELKANYLRPLTVAAGTVGATGTVLHLGGQIAVAEARVTDAAGKLYAHATSTCMLLRG
mgnify:CR=1 FL=1